MTLPCDPARRLALARRRIARAFADGDAEPRELGAVRLLPHQREAVARLRPLLQKRGVALLADATGLGKTYVALALAREWTRPLLVAPAALRGTWARAMRSAGVALPFISAERLSRGPARRDAPDLVVVDEAHHFRNPRTRRWRHLAGLVGDAPLLLLSATPLHNRPADVRALLSLALGDGARALDEAAVARLLVRRDERDAALAATLPRASPPEALPLAADPRVLAALLALPPPVPPRDGGDGGALVALGLVRHWCSSDGALRAALRRRLQRAIALEHALATGAHPSVAELRAWMVGDDAVQLGLPLDAPAAADTTIESLASAVREHAEALRALLRGPLAASRRDAARAEQLRALRRRHPGVKIVAFTQFAATVRALRRELAAEPGVCALTAAGAEVAGGRLRREEAIARFAPAATGRAPPREAERIDLLLTTDLLAEGVNLQDAGVVVHLDLPWTPARLEQRLGRVRRIGSRHARVASYVCPPPFDADAVLGLERRLRRKVHDVAVHVGPTGLLLPDMGRTTAVRRESRAAADAAVRRLVAAWEAEEDEASGEVAERPLVAAVRARRSAALALVRMDDAPRLVAVAAGVSDEPAAVLRLLRAMDAEPAPPDAVLARRVLARLARWLDARRGCALLRLDAGAATARRRVLARLARVSARTPRHRRAAVGALVDAARRAASVRVSAGAEPVLRALADAPLDDEAWLRAVAAFAEAREAPRLAAEAARVEVLVLLGRGAP